MLPKLTENLIIFIATAGLSGAVAWGTVTARVQAMQEQAAIERAGIERQLDRIERKIESIEDYLRNHDKRP